MTFRIIRESESERGFYRLVEAYQRQYKVHLRPARDSHGYLIGYIPSIEPVQPIYGTIAAADRVVMLAIERMTAPTFTHPEPTTGDAGERHAARR